MMKKLATALPPMTTALPPLRPPGPNEEIQKMQVSITYVLEYDFLVPKGNTLLERVANMTGDMTCNIDRGMAAEACVHCELINGVTLVQRTIINRFPEIKTL